MRSILPVRSILRNIRRVLPETGSVQRILRMSERALTERFPIRYPKDPARYPQDPVDGLCEWTDSRNGSVTESGTSGHFKFFIFHFSFKKGPGLSLCECFALLRQQFIAFTLLHLYWLFRPSNNCFFSHQRIAPIYTNLPNSHFLIQKSNLKSRIPKSRLQIPNLKKKRGKSVKMIKMHTLYPMLYALCPYVPMPLCPYALCPMPYAPYKPYKPLYPIHLIPPFTEHKST